MWPVRRLKQTAAELSLAPVPRSKPSFYWPYVAKLTFAVAVKCLSWCSWPKGMAGHWTGTIVSACPAHMARRLCGHSASMTRNRSSSPQEKMETSRRGGQTADSIMNRNSDQDQILSRSLFDVFGMFFPMYSYRPLLVAFWCNAAEVDAGGKLLGCQSSTGRDSQYNIVVHQLFIHPSMLIRSPVRESALSDTVMYIARRNPSPTYTNTWRAQSDYVLSEPKIAPMAPQRSVLSPYILPTSAARGTLITEDRDRTLSWGWRFPKACGQAFGLFSRVGRFPGGITSNNRRVVAQLQTTHPSLRRERVGTLQANLFIPLCLVI